MPLQPNEVHSEHISNGAVTTPKIADEQITSAKIKNSAVTNEKLATGAVTGSKLSDNAVTGSKIRDGTVRSEKIAAGAITTAKIGEQQVTGSRIKDNAITTEKIVNNAVTTQKIANGAVTPAKLSFAPPAVVRPITPPVVTDEIANGAVTPEKLSFVPGEVRPLVPPIATNEIADGAVTNAKLQYDKLPLIREKIWGVSLPASGASSISNEGILGGLSNMGGVANANDSDGRAKNFTTSVAINSNAGIGPSNYLTTQRRYNPALVCKFKLGNTDNLRFMCGLFSAPAIGSDDPSSLSCIMLRASTSALNTNFVAYVSDGISSVYADFPIPVPIDTNYHIFEIAISADGAVIKVTLDDQSFIISGSVPALEQDLGFECIIRTLENASKSFRYYGAQIVQ